MEAIIKHYDSYNARRYSRPWVCRMTSMGEYDFDPKVGTYTGYHNQHSGDGGEGDLVVFDPIEGAVYGYGQKDSRGGHTKKAWVLWDGNKFVPCDKLGKTND